MLKIAFKKLIISEIENFPKTTKFNVNVQYWNKLGAKSVLSDT